MSDPESVSDQCRRATSNAVTAQERMIAGVDSRRREHSRWTVLEACSAAHETRITPAFQPVTNAPTTAIASGIATLAGDVRTYQTR